MISLSRITVKYISSPIILDTMTGIINYISCRYFTLKLIERKGDIFYLYDRGVILRNFSSKIPKA